MHKKHPHERHLLEFIGKISSQEYCKTVADWVKKEYPGSADKLLPALRERYKKLG